jgi:GNAT superfamily N-acetyltransferase
MGAVARIQPATIDNVDVLVKHRRWMAEDIAASRSQVTDPSRMCAMEKVYNEYPLTGLADGTIHSWVAFVDGKVAASVTVSPMSWPPIGVLGRERNALLHSLYTLREHRRRGIARQLMAAAVDWRTREHTYSIFLGASEEGRPLYESMGFKALNQMRLILPQTAC